MSDNRDAPEAVLQRIQKLLQLAAKNPSEAEAASAAAKAQELMEEWNLTASEVGNKTDGGRREDAKVRGGFYKWQRWLWDSVAELNFCLYFTENYWDKNRGRYGRASTRHRLVGRALNVAAARATATYLEEVIERLVMERVGNDNSQRFSNWASSYRLGAAARLVDRLSERRKARKEDEERRAREAANLGGASTATALTITDVEERERAANQDFLWGEGFSARAAARRAEAAAARKENEEEYTRWAAANPEEAAKKERERRVAAERRRGRRTKLWDHVDWSAYRAGGEAAKDVSLDPQVGDGKPAGLLR